MTYGQDRSTAHQREFRPRNHGIIVSHRNISLLFNDHLFKQARKELDGLKQASRALARLQSSLAAKTEFMERAVHPAVLHRGIQMLPNELLMRVIQNCLPEASERTRYPTSIDHRENENVRRLALVSRRFRDLIYGEPSIWEDICYDGGQVTERATRIMERTTNIGLRVCCTSKGGLEGLQYSHRWISLRLNGLCTFPSEATVLDGLQSLTLDLPLLPHRRPLAEFMDLLRLPALRELAISLPTAGGGGAFTPPRELVSQLSVLSLLHYRLHRDEDIHNLIDCLSSGAKLRTLIITCDVWSDASFLEPMNPHHPVHLVMLESLRLKLAYVQSRAVEPDQAWKRSVQRAVSPIARAFIMPKLQILSLTLGGTGDLISLEDAFPPDRDYTRLQRLELALPGRSWGTLYPIVFRRFPRVQSLGLSVLNRENEELPGTLELAKLQELHLHYVGDRMSQVHAEKDLLAIFSQMPIGLKRVVVRHYTVVADIGGIEAHDFAASPFWTNRLRRKLKGDFYIEFS